MNPASLVPACHVALAEAVAAIGNGDLAVGSNFGGDLVALAIGGVLDICNHVGRCVVRRVVVEEARDGPAERETRGCQRRMASAVPAMIAFMWTSRLSRSLLCACSVPVPRLARGWAGYEAAGAPVLTRFPGLTLVLQCAHGPPRGRQGERSWLA
jgi:hypothetical protein